MEYELVSGTAKELPVFTADSDQVAVLKQWDQSKAAFALMDANNIEILIPYQDIKTVKSTEMNSLIDQYDNQVFKLYDELTGIPTNTVRDQPVKGRYFTLPIKMESVLPTGRSTTRPPTAARLLLI